MKAMSLGSPKVVVKTKGKFSDITTKQYKWVRSAVTKAATEVMKNIRKRGYAEIRSAGNFSARSARGLKVYKLRKRANRTVVRSRMNEWLNLFERGATVEGKPLLWIPISGQEDAEAVAPKDYNGKLFRLNRGSGVPLLLSSKGVAKYYGIESIKEPKLFDIEAVVESEASNVPEYYKRAFADKQWNRL